MLCVDIEYKWLLWHRRKRSYAPSKWAEMDERHFMAVVRALRGEISDEEYMSILFGVSRRLVRRLDPWHVYLLRKQVRFLDKGYPAASRFFVGRIESLLSPQPLLADVSLQQFMTADTFFSQYVDSIDEEHPDGDVSLLCRFVAALYMRSNENYFVEATQVRRNIFDLPGQEEKVVDLEGNTQLLLKRADRTKLWAVYLNWTMIRNWLHGAYPHLFPDGKGGDADANGHSKASKNVWLSTFDSFMGDDVAHIDSYRRMACTDAFRLMNKRIIDSHKRAAERLKKR